MEGDRSTAEAGVAAPRCPLCGGGLVDIRSKAVCSSCGRIAEGCCEGAPGACRPA